MVLDVDPPEFILERVEFDDGKKNHSYSWVDVTSLRDICRKHGLEYPKILEVIISDESTYALVMNTEQVVRLSKGDPEPVVF